MACVPRVGKEVEECSEGIWYLKGVCGGLERDWISFLVQGGSLGIAKSTGLFYYLSVSLR